MLKIKHRSILLLEVLIAFAIIVMCIFPLIYPHVALVKAQKEFIQKIEIDHAVTLLFGQIYQDLHTNQIAWKDIEAKKRFELSEQDFKKFNAGKALPFKGYYYFEPLIYKPKNQPKEETSAHLMNLIIKLYPQSSIRSRKAQKALEYKYKVFILRNPKSTQQEPDKQSDEKSS